MQDVESAVGDNDLLLEFPNGGLKQISEYVSQMPLQKTEC